MDHIEVSNLLMQRFLTEFSGEFPIALPNQAFTPPEPAPGAKWAQIDVLFSNGEQSSLGATGNRRFEHGGSFIARVFTRTGSATNDNHTLCKRVLNLMGAVRLDSSLWTQAGRIFTVGAGTEWYQQNVIITFTFDEIR